MARRSRPSRLDAPYLRRVWLDPSRIEGPDRYPFNIDLFRDGFALDFASPVTIVVGENGSGKSTLLEGIAALAGYDSAGGGKGYRSVDHAMAIETSGDLLGEALRASWLPKITQGWFFRAESFFSVARYLDAAAVEANEAPPDYLSHSHGEGFLRFFEERCVRQGFFIFDEPESALSPLRQIAFLKILRRMQEARKCQAIIATHSPILMACPGADLLEISRAGLSPARLEDTQHFRLMRELCESPASFIELMLEDAE